MNWDERGRLWVAVTLDYPNELQAGRQGPRPHRHLRGHRRRRQGRQGHRLRRQAQHSDEPDLRQRRRHRPPGAAHAVPQGHQGRRQGGRAQGAVQRLGHARHARRAEQPAATGSTTGSTACVGYSGFAGTRRRRDAIASARASIVSRRTVRSWNSCAAPTTTPGASASARKGLLFGSTANGNPSVYLPIPNRYYESVRGWTSSVLPTIADSARLPADHRQGAPGGLARPVHRRRGPRALHGPHLSAGVLEPHRLRDRADRPSRRRRSSSSRTAPTSTRATPGTCWPATTNGALRSWRRSAPTATSG